MIIPPVIVSELREKANSNKIFLMAIFQSAWGILLQEANHVVDVAFSTLMLDRSSEDFYTFPLRLKIDVKKTLKELTDEHFKQLIISQPYAYNSLKAIQKILVPQEKKFDHVLSFGDFLSPGNLFAETAASPEGKLVFKNSWSLQGLNLGIYFYNNEDTVSVTFIYDENRFAENFGVAISRRYYLVLQQMLTDWNLPYEIFLPRLTERLEGERQIFSEDRESLRDFLSHTININTVL